MIKVQGRRNSANVQKVMWTLGELDLEYVREDVGGSFGYPANYKNPTQVVPTIHDQDFTVWESNACVRYLAKAYGEGSLWPTDNQTLATADQWMEWMRSEFSGAFFPVFQGLIKFDKTPNELHQQINTLGNAYGQLDEWLQNKNFIAGDTLTVGDIPIGTMTYRFMTMPITRPALPNVEKWYERLCNRTAYQKHVMVPYGSNSKEWAIEEANTKGVQ